MQYSIEQIRSVRDIYTQAPYPGFSLEEVVKRRKALQSKSVKKKNPNAWVAKGTAKTAEEWLTRLVRSNLNKLSARNSDIILSKLRIKELFESPDSISLVVSMIFEKALNEPENSKLYAAVCRELARFEINEVLAKTSGGKTEESSRSKLRDAIIDFTQNEFKAFRFDPTKVKGLTAEDLQDEELVDTYRSLFVRRKRANMRFVGELYLNSTLMYSSMLSIATVALNANKKGVAPEEENIELISELFTTIGEKLDSERKADVDKYFVILQNIIKTKPCPYTQRIIFQIMNLIDLRKAAWGTKAPKEKTTSKRSERNRKPKANKGVEALKSWRDLAEKPPAASSSNPKPRAKQAAAEVPTVPFESRVHSLLEEWVAHRSNDFIPDWMDEFDHCDPRYEPGEELAVAVGVEVINKSCLTTRVGAQQEAYSFLGTGLDMTDEEFMSSFATAALTAYEEGFIEDAPKYPERFMRMLRFSSGSEELTADVYFDAAVLLIKTYNMANFQAESEYEPLRDTLLDFWKMVPTPSPAADMEDRVILGKTVLLSICADTPNMKPGLEVLVMKILMSLQTMGVAPPEEMEELLEIEDDSLVLFTKVATLLKGK